MLRERQGRVKLVRSALSPIAPPLRGQWGRGGARAACATAGLVLRARTDLPGRVCLLTGSPAGRATRTRCPCHGNALDRAGAGLRSVTVTQRPGIDSAAGGPLCEYARALRNADSQGVDAGGVGRGASAAPTPARQGEHRTMRAGDRRGLLPIVAISMLLVVGGLVTYRCNESRKAERSAQMWREAELSMSRLAQLGLGDAERLSELVDMATQFYREGSARSLDEGARMVWALEKGRMGADPQTAPQQADGQAPPDGWRRDEERLY